MTSIHQTKFIIKQKAIHCASCENRIRTVLGSIPGILVVTASHSTQEVMVRYDQSQIDAESIMQVLDRMGFPASYSSEGGSEEQ